jgi:hypothetical protein
MVKYFRNMRNRIQQHPKHDANLNITFTLYDATFICVYKHPYC